jgi:hypothetical protein
VRLAIAPAAFIAPPVANGVDGKARYVKAVTDADVAAVGVDIIDAIRHGLTDGILRPIVHQYRLGRLAPLPSCVLEIADQFFFFVSTLMMGSPVAVNCARCSVMCSNCAWRSVGEAPRASVRRALAFGE